MEPVETNRKERKRIAIQERKRLQQQNFISCFAKTGFNVARTCRLIGISRTVYNIWDRADPRFSAMIAAAKEEKTDLAESILLSNMQDNNKFVSNAATIFYLKTIGKDRGYTERKDIDITVTQNRSKEEIDAIVAASRQTDSVKIDARDIIDIKELPEPTRMMEDADDLGAI